MNYCQADTTILLSTYNGEKYLEEQLESLINQTYRNWVLFIRDDGSTDSTMDIVRFYTKKDARMVLVTTTPGNLGPADSFISLLSRVETPYFMFCDQDDVWLPSKIEVSIAPLRTKSAPHLVFTDLCVVDEKLERINDSFMGFSRLDPKSGTSIKKLLMQNTIVGCTIAANIELLKRSGLHVLPRPANIIMHDWWLALVASAFGSITYIKEPSILYRQHGGNCLGAKKSGFWHYMWMLSNQKPWLKAQKYIHSVSAQAESFYESYSECLNVKDKKHVEKVVSISKGVALVRLILCLAQGIQMHKADRNIALLLSFSLGKMPSVWSSAKIVN